MPQLIFRCDRAKRVITSGIEIDFALFASLQKARYMQCRFCGQEHVWEVVEKLPVDAALMSIRAENFLARCVQSETFAVEASDPVVRNLHERMAGQWYQLAIEHEAKAAALG